MFALFISQHPKQNNKNTKIIGYVWILRCLKHGIGLGFHVGLNESPNDAFSAIFERFKEPPKVMVSDWECNVAIYCWNREPEYYEKVVHAVDEMHGAGHTRCSGAFQAKYFKESHMNYATINDSGILSFFCFVFGFLIKKYTHTKTFKTKTP